MVLIEIELEGEDVGAVLTRLKELHGPPDMIQCDQSTEYTSMAMDLWAYWNSFQLDFKRHGKPGDNTRNEAFNSIVIHECLSQHYLMDLKEAQQLLEHWRQDNNNTRPHGSLEQISPAKFKADWLTMMDLSKLE